MDLISLIKQSEKNVILGYSGSGKTTLLKYLVDRIIVKNGIIVDTVDFFLNANLNMKFVGYKGNYKNFKVFKLHTERELNGLVYYLNENIKGYYIVIDEVDRYSNPLYLPFYTKLFLEEGRNYDRGGLFTIRRVGFLNKSILGNSHYLFLFKVNVPADIINLSNIIGIDIKTLKYSREHSFYVIDLFLSKLLGENYLNISV